jgi:hypothetical protein
MIVLCYNSAFIYTAGISRHSSVIWELIVVFLYLKWLRMSTRAINVPHLKVRPIKVSNLKQFPTRADQNHCLHGNMPGSIKQEHSDFVQQSLTHRAVSNNGHVRRTSLSLLVSALSFAGFVASSTALFSYSFVLQSEKEG